MVGVAAVIVAVVAAACSGPIASPTSDASSSGDPVSASPEGSGTPPLDGDPLQAGTYAIDRGTLNATISVPAGWSSLDGRGVAKGDDESSMVVVFWPFPEDFAAGVYTDPCSWAGNEVDPPVGPTVDDLANALAAQSMRGDPVPTDVTIGGYDGKILQMSVPDDIDFADCDLNEFRSWAGRHHQGPGQRDDVYILDVDGERQVLIAHRMPGVSEAAEAEQQAVIDSIQLTP